MSMINKAWLKSFIFASKVIIEINCLKLDSIPLQSGLRAEYTTTETKLSPLLHPSILWTKQFFRDS